MCNGDSALMMSWFGLAGSLNNSFAVLLSPIVGSLSDAIGRKWVVAIGRTGAAMFFMSSYLARNMRQQCILNVIGFGIMMPGNIPAQQAMFDDLFGTRPKLAALILADNNSKVYFLELIAPILGAWVASNYEPLGHFVPTAAMLATSVLWATGTDSENSNKNDGFLWKLMTFSGKK